MWSYPRALTLVLALLSVLEAALAAVYYIDYSSGQDSNSGTSKAAPWKHVPAMAPFSGSYTHADGDRFIFKGGVTWPNAAVPLYITQGGSPSSYDYYGVDQTWFSGSQFSRPILTANHRAFVNHVAVARENMIRIVGPQSRNLHIDNLDIREWVVSNPVANDTDCAGINGYTTGDILITNCRITDFRPSRMTEGGGGIIGGYQSWPVWVQDCVVQGPFHVEQQFKSDPNGFTMGSGIRNVSSVERCDVSGVSQGIVSGGWIAYNYVHDGGQSITFGHENLIDVFGASADIVGNVGRGWNGVGLFVRSGWGGRSSRVRVWNNVFYWTPQHVISNEQGPPGNTSSVFFANNTIVGTRVALGYKASAPWGGGVVLSNNLFIDDRASSTFLFNSPVPPGLIEKNTVRRTYAQALAAGMDWGNHYAPTKALAGVTDAGNSDYASVFRDDVKRVPRPQGSAWDVGAYEFKATSGETRPPPPTALRVQG